MLPVIIPPQGGFRLLSEVPLLDSPRLSLVGLRNSRGPFQCRAKTSSSATWASIPHKEHHYGHLSVGQDHGRTVRGPTVVKHENDVDNDSFDNGVLGDSNRNLHTNSALSHGEKITVSVRIHSVSAGETVSSIASSYSIPVEALLAANSKSSPSIRVGEVLYLPSSSAPSVASSQPKALSPSQANPASQANSASQATSASQSGRSQHVSLHIRENHGTSSRQTTFPSGAQECVRLCTDSSGTMADGTSLSTGTSSSSSSSFSDARGPSAAAAAASAGRVCITSCREAPTGRTTGMRMRVRGWLKNSSGAGSVSPNSRVIVSPAAPSEGVSPSLLVTSAPAASAAAVADAAPAAAVAVAPAGGSTHAAGAPDAHSHADTVADTPSDTSAAAEYDKRRFTDELSGFANFFAARKHLSRTMHLDGWKKGSGGTHAGIDGTGPRQGVVASVTQAFVPVRAGEVQQSLPLIGLGVAITVAAGALAVRSGLHGLVHAAVLLRLQGFSQKQHDQRQQQQEREKEQQGEGSEQNGGRINEQESLQRVKDEKRLEFSKRALRNYLDLQKREVKRSGMEGAALRLKMRMAKANGKDPLPFAPLQDKMGPRRNVMAEIRSVVAEAVAEVVEGEECTVVLERSKAQVKDVESTGEPMVVEKRVIMENDTGRGAEEAGRMIEMMEKGWYGGAVEAESGRMTGPEGDEYGLGEVGPEVFLEWSVEKAREANAHAAMRLPINTNERG